MDIRIEKKKGIRALFTKKGIPYLAGALFLVFVLWLLLRDNSSTLRVDARTISVGQVVSGEFNDYIRVTGQVQPITTVQLSPLEAGIVERLVVEEGTSVKKGDVLVVLSNTSLTLEILNSEAELAEKQNILRNTLISMEQEKLSLRQDKAQLDLDVSRKKRAWQQNEELYRNALIAREEWLQSKEDYELAEKKRELNIERQVQDSLYRSVQIEQMEENLDNMKRNMQLIRERIGNLNVKSPIDGEVGLLDIVLGQSVSTGQKIGQINDLSDYKVEAQIDESYIDRVRAGLEATFDRQGTDYKVRLRQSLSRGAQRPVPSRLHLPGRPSREHTQRPDLLPASRTGAAYRGGHHPPRVVLPDYGRRMDLCPCTRGRQGLQTPHPHRPPEPAVLRGARRAGAGRAGHRFGL